MRIITIILITSLLGLAYGEAPKTKQEKINLAYNVGMQAMQEGDFAKAEKYLKAVVKASPSHGNAKYGLLQLKQARSTAKNTKSKDRFNGVTIPKVEFEDLPFAEAIDAFRLLTDNANGERGAPNISIIDPNNKLEKKTVTVTLENVPANAVLNYLTDSAGAQHAQFPT